MILGAQRLRIEAREGEEPWKPLALRDDYSYAPRFDSQAEAEAMLGFVSRYRRKLGQEFRVTAEP